MPGFVDLMLDESRSSAPTPTFRVLDEPILLFDRFEIREVMAALGVVIFFGVIGGAWFVTAGLTGGVLVGSPWLRGRFPPGTIARMVSDRFSRLPAGPFTWGRTRTIWEG